MSVSVQCKPSLEKAGLSSSNKLPPCLRARLKQLTSAMRAWRQRVRCGEESSGAPFPNMSARVVTTVIACVSVRCRACASMLVVICAVNTLRTSSILLS